MGTNACYLCGQECHKAKNCLRRAVAQQQQRIGVLVHNIQAAIKGLTIQQGRLEAPPPAANARIFAFTVEEAATTSNVVIGQILVNLGIEHVLFDTGVFY